jgi:putative glycosyltransferase (TIGR04372 family)
MCSEMDNSIFFSNNGKKWTLDLRYFNFKYPEAISNSFLFDLLRRKFIFLPAYFLFPILFWAKKYKVFNKHALPYMCGRTVTLRPSFRKPTDLEWFTHFQSSGLKNLIEDYEIKSSALLKLLNLSNKQLIGIHVRDSEWQKMNFENIQKNTELNNIYEAINRFEQNSTLRNSSLLNFIDAVKALDGKNITSIRFGRPSKVYPKSNIIPLIDYGNSGFSTDKNDILLMGKIKYLICSISGVKELAHWMRVPVFLIDIVDIFDWAAIYATVNSIPIILPKEIRWKSTAKLLSIEEIKNLELFKLPTEIVRRKIIAGDSIIYFSENSSNIIQKTILLGHDLLSSNKVNELIKLGKDAYRTLYDKESFELAPVLSPFWPNLQNYSLNSPKFK